MRLLIKTDQSTYPEKFSVSYLAIRNDDLWLVRFECCVIELTPSRLTRVVKKTIARAYYKEINLTRLIRSPICVIILLQRD